MKILFAGTPQTAVPSLHALLEAGHEILSVLTRAPAPAGRRHRLIPSAVNETADDLGIPVLTPATLKEADIQRRICELQPEAIAVVAYGLLVPRELLTLPTHGWINLHFSLLPSWRGAAPVQYAISSGDKETGACTFRIEEGLDTGPVFDRLTTAIGAEETAGDLLARLSLSGAELLVGTLEALEEGRAHASPQEGTPTLAPTITTQDAQVRWNDTALAITRRSRAHTPAPGPWTRMGDTRIKLGPLTISMSEEKLAPGQILAGKRVIVGTAEGNVELSTVSPAGKRAMPAADWARGARLDTSAHFDGELQ